MAPKFFFRILNFFIIVCIIAIPTTAFAAAPEADLGIREHSIVFYLDPSLVPDMNFAKAVLAAYVEDMNAILAKNTSRHLYFDPSTGIIPTSVQPHSNQAASPLPTENFAIWAHAVHTDYPVSYGGYAGLDDSGAGVLAGLKWTRLYDPNHLNSAAEVTDYWTQINNMLHELAHVFGAGYGEYYNLSSIQDTTGELPLLNINILDPNDPFWSDKTDFTVDPLLRNLVQNNANELPTRESLLNTVEYSQLTATIMNNDYRNAAPSVDLSHINIKIVSETGLPIVDAKIKIWSVEGPSPNRAQLITDEFSNINGELNFAWGGASGNAHNGYDFLRLIKVYKPGYTDSAKYISIFDADIAKLVNGSDFLNITIRLNTIKASSPVSTFADVPVEDFAMPYIERIYAAGITGGCSTMPLLYCPGNIVTRAQMAIFLERSMKGVGFSPTGAGGVMFGDVQANTFAAAWIEQLASEGITGGCGGGNYCPDAPVTRAQMAIFILRAKYGPAYTPPVPSGLVFQDVPANYWAAAWLEQFSKEGITSGCGNGNYCPDMPVTRSQMAIFLTKAFNFQ